MKADDSSSSLLNIMIPQFQQLLPLETPSSGSWLNTHYMSESTNKLLSPPVSVTPTSICTDLSESEYQPIDLSSSLRKYSISSPPLSNIKSETIDSIDCSSNMIISNHEKQIKSNKQYSNFSIEYLLSSSSSSLLPYKQIRSIFSKIKSQHYSDRYLHQIISRRKQSKQSELRYSIQPRGLFLRYIFDLYNDLINQHHHGKIWNIDPLKQLAEIACKIDTRHQKNFIFNEDLLTLKTSDFLLKQCYRLIKQIDQKYQSKKIRKRLYYGSKSKLKERFLHFSLSILNLLQKKKNHLLNSSDCHHLTSDISNEKSKIKKSICFHLKSDQITSNLEILLPNNGLIYEGIIQTMGNFDDLLLVRLNHERQTYLIPIHDLCRLACPKMIPGDFNILSKGLRVCAYWSTSLRGLHPAIVKKIPTDINESSMISLAFDDGDSGLIKLDEIRLLPDNYDVKGINLEEWRVSSFQIPSILPTSRRRRVSSSASMNSNSSSLKRLRKAKPSIVVPQWTLNSRNSTICRHDKKQTLHVGDCVLLHGVEESLSYIGKVLKFYHNKSTEQDLVRLKWYYSPQETPLGLHENDLPGALYESTHIDDNPISTIRSKGTIYASFDDYVRKTNSGKKRKETDFYLVGHYNPTTGKLQRYDKK